MKRNVQKSRWRVAAAARRVLQCREKEKREAWPPLVYKLALGIKCLICDTRVESLRLRRDLKTSRLPTFVISHSLRNGIVVVIFISSLCVSSHDILDFFSSPWLVVFFFHHRISPELRRIKILFFLDRRKNSRELHVKIEFHRKENIF